MNARVFMNGQLAYVVTDVQTPYPCPVYNGQYPTQPTQCTGWQQQVQVIDLSGGSAKPRGTIALPIDPNGWYGGWGWGGFYYYDWYEGGGIVQVGADALAFRRCHPNYSSTGQYVCRSSDLFVVDLSNPDQPGFASTSITNDPNGWWGNMKVINNTLYTTHYVWPTGNVQNPTVRYYLDYIDLTDRKNPKVQASINVPGILVGGSTGRIGSLHDRLPLGYETAATPSTISMRSSYTAARTCRARPRSMAGSATSSFAGRPRTRRLRDTSTRTISRRWSFTRLT